jgi:hypothetical protein
VALIRLWNGSGIGRAYLAERSVSWCKTYGICRLETDDSSL